MDQPCFKYQVYDEALKGWQVGYMGAVSINDAEVKLKKKYKTTRLSVIKDPEHKTYADWISAVNSRRID